VLKHFFCKKPYAMSSLLLLGFRFLMLHLNLAEKSVGLFI